MKFIFWGLSIIAALAIVGAFMGGNIFAGLVLVVSAFLLCPLFHPWFEEKFGSKASPGKLVTLGILTFFGSGFVVDDVNSNSAERSATEQLQAHTSEQENLLSVDEFRHAYNNLISELELSTSYQFYELDCTDGDVNDSCTYLFNNNLAFTGVLSKGTDSLKSVTLIATPSSESDVADAMVVMSALVGAFSPQTTPEERGELILPMLEAAIKDGEDGTKQLGSINYSLLYNDQMGIWFTVEPA